MPGLDIRKDDMVRVIAGKDKGREGRVVRVFPKRRRVMVDGVAMAKKHQSTRSSGRTGAMQQGGIIDVEMSVDISNIQLVCGACGRPTRVGHGTDEDGHRVRICRSCKAEI